MDIYVASKIIHEGSTPVLVFECVDKTLRLFAEGGKDFKILSDDEKIVGRESSIGLGNIIGPGYGRKGVCATKMSKLEIEKYLLRLVAEDVMRSTEDEIKMDSLDGLMTEFIEYTYTYILSVLLKEVYTDKKLEMVNQN